MSAPEGNHYLAVIDTSTYDPNRICPDGGTCHHDCDDDAVCFRVECCASFRPDGGWRTGGKKGHI